MNRVLTPVLLTAVAVFAACSTDSEEPFVETAQNYQLPASYQYPDSAAVVSHLQSGEWKEVRTDNLSHIIRFDSSGAYQDNRNWNFGPHFFKWQYSHTPRQVYIYYQGQDSLLYFVDSVVVQQIDPQVLFYHAVQTDSLGNEVSRSKALFRKFQP